MVAYLLVLVGGLLSNLDLRRLVSVRVPCVIWVYSNFYSVRYFPQYSGYLNFWAGMKCAVTGLDFDRNFFHCCLPLHGAVDC